MKHSAILWRALFSIVSGFAFIIIYNGTAVMAVGMALVIGAVMIMGYGITRKNWLLWGYVTVFILFALFSIIIGWIIGGMGYAFPLLICLACTYLLLAHDPIKHLTGKKPYPAVELGSLTQKINNAKLRKK